MPNRNDSYKFITHECGNYHYGNMSVVRECCVENVLHWKNLAIRNAFSTEHPVYRKYAIAWNELTDAEMSLVGELWYNMDKGFYDPKLA